MRWIKGITLLLFALPAVATSLFSDESFKALTSDPRATRIGDTVSIIVLENSQAKSGATESTDSDFRFNASALSPQGRWPYGLSLESGDTGDASIGRNAFVKAQITVVVERIDDNGNLFISGKQNIVIDGEKQSIEITGWLRSSDISAENTVLSSRVFDANITFVGEGVVTEGKEGGWIKKALKWIGFA